MAKITQAALKAAKGEALAALYELDSQDDAGTNRVDLFITEIKRLGLWCRVASINLHLQELGAKDVPAGDWAKRLAEFEAKKATAAARIESDRLAKLEEQLQADRKRSSRLGGLRLAK